MGLLTQIWDRDYDPTDASNPNGTYTPYTFADVLPTQDWGIARRESVMAIPGLDGVVSGFGEGNAGPLEKRYFPWGFRVMTKRGPDAAHDLLMAAILGTRAVRLVYKTDGGTLRFTTGVLVSTKENRTNDQPYFFDFTATWRIRPDWRLHDPEAVFPTFAADNSEVFSVGNTEVFLNPGGLQIVSAVQAFTMDATGTAGVNLPTLPDTGPFFTFTGPCGGDSGLLVANTSYTVRDASRTKQQIYFSIPFKLPTANDSCSLDFASQTFLHNGVPFRPIKPDYQREWFRVVPGIVNHCTASSQGTNPLTGGTLSRNFWRKFA